MSPVRDDFRSSFKNSFFWFSITLLGFMVALLVGPRLPDDQQSAQCVVNVHLPGPFGIGINCDSAEFMRLAREPSALLEPLNTRQSRPGLIAAAAAMAWVLSPLTSLAERLGVHASRPDINPERIAESLAKDIPGYLAYIFLNVGILLATFYLFLRTCAPWADNSTLGSVILVAVGFLFVANDVVKAFVWSPHTQMFNILVPVFVLYASMRANAGALVERRFAISIGIVAGLGGTAYPSFVIVLPCVAVCSLVFVLRYGSRTNWSRSIVNIGVLAALIFVPEALWGAFVLIKTGGFYQHEIVAYRQVLWILDAWHQGVGTLVATWWSKFELLLRFAAMQAVPLAFLLVMVAVLGLVSRGDREGARPPFWPLALTGFLVSTVTAVFYASVGLIVPRVAYSVIPALIVVVATAALVVIRRENASGRIFAYCCVAFSIVAASYTVIKSGPYS